MCCECIDLFLMSSERQHILSLVLLGVSISFGLACLFGGRWGVLSSHMSMPWGAKDASGGDNGMSVSLGLLGTTTRAWGKSHYVSYSSLSGGDGDGNDMNFGGGNSDMSKIRFAGAIVLVLLTASLIAQLTSLIYLAGVYPLNIVIGGKYLRSTLYLVIGSCIGFFLSSAVWTFVVLSASDSIESNPWSGGFLGSSLSFGWCYWLCLFVVLLSVVGLYFLFQASEDWNPYSLENGHGRWDDVMALGTGFTDATHEVERRPLSQTNMGVGGGIYVTYANPVQPNNHPQPHTVRVNTASHPASLRSTAPHHPQTLYGSYMD